MYAKLFSSILNSSIWSEDAEVCKVWITLLAMMDREGYIFGSEIGIARITVLPIGVVSKAIKRFTRPDPQSGDITRNGGDGKRVSVIPGGWRVLNAAFYRDLASSDGRYEQEVNRDGYVYFMRKASGGNIKIGFSANPWSRCKEMETASDEPFILLGVVKGKTTDELRWHKEFSADRVRREWFKPTEALLKRISESCAATTKTATEQLRSRSDSDSDSDSDSKANTKTEAHKALSVSVEANKAEDAAQGGRRREAPTLEACKLLAAKAGIPEEQGEAFFNYYESNGWRVGKNPMRSPGGAMGGWALRYKEKHGTNNRADGGSSTDPNPRNRHCGPAVTDYAAAFKRKAERAEKEAMDRQMAKNESEQTSAT